MAGKITVDVVSDTVCPWCFIGKRRLESAIKRNPGRDFLVRWHPFQLNPNASAEGVNKLQYYKDKFGESRTAAMLPRMTETFAQEGLAYSMDGLTGNTLDSHRLIAAAGQQGPQVQDALVEELFSNYFTQGKYINDPEVLKAAGQKAGVTDSDAVVKDKDRLRAEVIEELQSFARGVTGVPYFIIDGKYALSGAQEPAAFEEAFARLA
ncbi:hypothetical protein WJX74_003649 [Apatococcus lobatus]|uniref:DSBA-like thioredoxin domain-containing protein n=1 Tax=Apatococcus lobatus TaxID=904363 RepID=A0AAW1QW82_9CHLO